ncbi:hypothetical protein HMPREF9446_03290 [Bacteroides fluxus YIT 12057]|uniref:Uncharacterized protein n=1 Tax=Bacteroides fluxus YIT 12057 TaxID=763034 RepID=F3PX02_9BACE|nr:hypothetical protein HMPREF9446_03290 [Bacteroides fluxus YIT 12057]
MEQYNHSFISFSLVHRHFLCLKVHNFIYYISFFLFLPSPCGTKYVFIKNKLFPVINFVS